MSIFKLRHLFNSSECVTKKWQKLHNPIVSPSSSSMPHLHIRNTKLLSRSIPTQVLLQISHHCLPCHYKNWINTNRLLLPSLFLVLILRYFIQLKRVHICSTGWGFHKIWAMHCRSKAEVVKQWLYLINFFWDWTCKDLMQESIID